MRTVAIKYNPWFGDAFYNSSKFGMAIYLMRVFTSWAIVAEVFYHTNAKYTKYFIKYLHTFFKHIFWVIFTRINSKNFDIEHPQEGFKI